MIEIVTFLRWFASLSAIVAALLIAVRLSDRLVLFGFVLFTLSSAAWIAAALLGDANALLTQNLVLFAINVFGVVRWFRSG